MRAFLEGLSPTLHISHRGGAGLYPENTLYAFQRAVDLWETDVLELDVHVTRDGEVVVAHDSSVDRCTDGRGEISQLDWADLKKLDAAFRTPLQGQGLRMPLFAEVLEAFPHTRMNVELKGGDVAVLARLVKPHLARLCLGSEGDALGEQLAAALPDGCHFFPSLAAANFVFGGPVDDRYHVLDLPFMWEGAWVFTPELKARAAEHGRWVNFWTVDDEADMRRLVADGAGGVMTDRPDVLRAVLQGA